MANPPSDSNSFVKAPGTETVPLAEENRQAACLAKKYGVEIDDTGDIIAKQYKKKDHVPRTDYSIKRGGKTRLQVGQEEKPTADGGIKSALKLKAGSDSAEITRTTHGGTVDIEATTTKETKEDKTTVLRRASGKTSGNIASDVSALAKSSAHVQHNGKKEKPSAATVGQSDEILNKAVKAAIKCNVLKPGA